MKTMIAPKPLWIGDNGRLTCRDCAGCTATASGMKRDLYGPMDPITAPDVLELKRLGFDAKCEGCDAPASMLAEVRSRMVRS